MRSTTDARLSELGIDAVALKPAEVDLSRARNLTVSTLTVDFEGREHVPDPAALENLADERTVRLTVPVRADGFDPLGDDEHLDSVPESVQTVLVAGHPNYLSLDERERAIAPRLRTAADRFADPWIGTEGVERLALAVGGTQFDLLTGRTATDVRELRSAGFEGDVAVYAPTVASKDTDEILDAVGDYAARRGPVARTLPEGAATDSRASGAARERLLDACRDYALVGSPERIRERVASLREAGVDSIVAYPARGLDAIQA